MAKKDQQIDEEILTSEEAMARAVVTLADTTKPKTMTRLEEKEIKVLSALLTLSKHYDIPILHKVCYNFMKLRVSHKGLGRSEILEIAKAAKEEKLEGSRLKKLLTFGGRI